MAKTLVIVESPAKAKTIGKFLGRNYRVKASIGHVRDLPKSKLGIDVENNYNPQYITIRGKGPVIKEIKAEAKKADKVLLATDPDREGEAISWHLANILSIDEKENCRIEFNEITSKAIKNAVKNPRPIKKKLVDAQQARRILDRLVGYSISPLLWKKIRRGLSAGRVQSVATKIICDREKEILNFKPKEYWTIDLILKSLDDSKKIEASFYGTNDKKIELENSEQVQSIIDNIKNNSYDISNIEKKLKRRKPYLPFTTSSLQQEASNKLGYSTKKTMLLAQQLYEGIDVEGEGTVGLITYIRTDSTRISDEAKSEADKYIVDKFTEKYLAKQKRKVKNKKDAQDAHEAIRPTSVLRTPTAIRNSLSNDQYNLYKLIWERFVASQMADATYNSYNVDIVNGKYLFKAKGVKQEFDGFLKVYSFAKITEKEVPDVKTGEVLKDEEINPKQHFTQPPPRYTEATLVKEMEEKGIGRPSTYSPTISTILSRGYIEREAKALKPTDLGFLINDILENHFADIVDVDFTANMESDLDKVEEGNISWIKIIDDFYKPFKKVLKKAEESIEKIDLTEKTDEICEKCGNYMVIKHGRFGKFLACSNYPECDFTKSIINKTGIKCPKCNGDIVVRKTKKGRYFYGCNNYPKCNFMTWNQPIDRKCPKCNSILVTYNTKKKKIIKCSSKDCKFKEEQV
ncbi:type I DNA topoisomerase [Paramaledivibacter caminithermalis]|jgi:DNA topoisomerase-1|uniref:DNA topoisomerase 1 n=1 Tax=Paramaledivibacter caminithermalis (strain DSM 15212 / CIP 107654 / DViRD3) TaxID=1121301 RepID=A0A1M6NKU7_PARC5|nr:type I DNA topoisomerase [Paramaledivibacter caminithermalis]SHJ96320.1 DNA topoisomerase-1 [Paramaledivibacter caminithermalis DSM 15212]